MMLRNVFTKDLWDRRVAMIWWVIGMVLMTAWLAALFPVLRDERISAVKEAVAGPPALLRRGEHGLCFFTAALLGEKLPRVLDLGEQLPEFSGEL